LTAIGIVGPGRAGLGLALALTQAGHVVRLHGRRGKDVPPPLSLSWGGVPPWLSEVSVVVLAVRDDAIAGTAEQLARGGAVTAAHVVLHLSGMLDTAPLAVLRSTGAALGCLHPLQAIARPEAAPARLRGALAALTGDPRAVEEAQRLAVSLGLRPVVLPAEGKARYHAAAAIASNYLVVLAAVAERLMAGAGIAPQAAREGITALMEGTLANVAEGGLAALTGPIVRGDVETVRAHLAILPPDVRPLYRALGRATLAVAGLEGGAGEAMQRVLEETVDDERRLRGGR
jgi:predicted short-subunit dehydrogenase-like oxidoreductase (DUF2520 family)